MELQTITQIGRLLTRDICGENLADDRDLIRIIIYFKELKVRV